MWTALKRVGVFACLCAFTLFISLSAGQAHTVTPSLGEVEVADGRAEFRLAVIAEGLVSGINLTGVKDTNSSPQSFVYDSLRALQPQDLAAKFTSFWPVMTKRITIKVDGVVMAPEAMQIDIPGVGDVATTRTSQLRFSVALPAGAKEIAGRGLDATPPRPIVDQRHPYRRGRPPHRYVRSSFDSAALDVGRGRWRQRSRRGHWQ